MKKKILSLVLTVMIILTVAVLPLSSLTASAASYPTVMHKNMGMQIYCGDTVPLVFTYFPAYNNERVTINIYSPAGERVANAEYEINNKYSNYGSITSTWDTTGYEPGKYDIEIIKEFYSLYSWHTAPTNGSSFVTLVKPDSSYSLKNSYPTDKTHFIVRNDSTTVNVANKGIKSAYNAWQKLKVTDVAIPYEIQMTEMYTGREAESIAVSQNMYNPSNNSSCQWYLMKFEVKNLGKSTLEFSDVIDWINTYLPTGQKSTLISTCTFGSYPDYGTEIEPNTTEEAWVGFYVLKSQGVPFLKLDNGAYLATHPSCSKGHDFANNTAELCKRCHAMASNLLVKENGKYYHVVNGKKVADTILFKHTDGKYYYVNKGVVDFTKTGLVKHTNGKYYYVQEGKVNTAKTGLVKHTNGKYYYVEKGIVNTAKTGLVKHTDGNYYYVSKGIKTTSTLLVKHTNGKYYYVQNGKVNFAKTGLVKHTNGIYYYVVKGVKSTATLLVKHSNGKWYYVEGGKVTTSKTGLVKHSDGKYYHVVKGVKTTSTGLVKHTNGKYYYVQSGKVNNAKTGLVKHTNGKYYYVEKGVVNNAKTGLVKHTNGKYYYVEKGVVNTAKNGRVKHTNGKYYTVKKGVVV